MDLVDLNLTGDWSEEQLVCRDPCGSRGSKCLRAKERMQPRIGRDPCGSRGSK